MPIGFLLRRAWHLYLFVCGMCFYSAVMKAAVERQIIPRDIFARDFLDKLDIYDTNSEQWRIYPVANEEIFLRAYLRPANETHYSRIVGCDLYRDEHRDTMVKRLTAGGTDPGRVNMATPSDSWQFSYLLHACKHVRLPNFDFDVPPVEEEAPPYHPITWLQLARNIRDWTKDYLREAFAEDPADTYTGEESRPLMWSELFHDTYKSVVEWFSPKDEATDAANTLLRPAGNTDPAETDASSVTWSHLWTEMGNKVSGVTAMFLSETPDDSATDGAPEIDSADPEPTGGVWAALQGLCTDLMNRLPSYRSDNTDRAETNKDPFTETALDFAECKAESQGGTASYYFSRTYWPWTTDEETPEPYIENDFAEGKAESQGGTLTTVSHTYFSRTYWPWTTDEETPEPDVQDDPAETGWSLAAWTDHIFQAKNLMIAQIWADPPVVLDDPP
ncbi:uncharacterized protein LOC118413938 isoform X2 [Branchiostoma floridae]|uniref:Uncharacterized protein LOC118413938 isoform X2 n=1 Tax=Branchiostoma floridae TaxID=7739 RepID=A0A9J7L1H7_BRAFL|nr:uncharacterized protein LOC118413938 isoform X2 [Branchiostoma floridae]